MNLSDISLIAQILSICIQPCTVGLIFLTFVVYMLQLRTMQAQLRAAREAAASQNLLSIIAFLQEESTRQARERVIKRISKLTRKQWTEDDQRAADKVCSTYDVAAILLRNNIVESHSIAENWGPSIIQCFKALEPYLREMQKPENAGPAYWKDFEWLYREALSFQPGSSTTEKM